METNDANSWSSPPIDPFPEAAELLGPKRVEQIVWAFIALGITVRLIRYLLQFPLWPDEAYLAHNYLDRGYLDLAKPLDYIQIAPLLYLWVQETFVKVFGFSEYSLRLFPLLCGIGGLLLFRHVAGRVFQGTAFLVSVAMFTVAYPLLRHSAEAKPYGSDVFTSLVLLSLAFAWCRRPRSIGWWLAATVAMPIAVLLSYPAVFLCGGVCVAMATVLLRQGSWKDWLRLAISGLALCASFAVLFSVSGRGQMSDSGEILRGVLADGFPSSYSPFRLLTFLLLNTNRSMCYPIGGNEWAPNGINSLLCLTGLVLLVRARRLSLVVLCLTPLALNFIAAVLKCYPYCDPWRLAIYMAPIFCLLVGLGLTQFLATLRRLGAEVQSAFQVLRPLATILVLFASIAVGASVRDFLHPCKEACWMRNRDFARWFWVDKAEGAELVCLLNDLHERFYAIPHDTTPAEALSSVYYCNQRIYSPRLARREPVELDRVSASHPLRCVRFRPTYSTSDDEAAFNAWLKTMESRYRLVGKERYPLTFWINDKLKNIDYVELYEFVPNDGGAGRANP